MVEVGVSSSSQLAADAGAQVAEAGGNAVDVAIAASLVSLVNEPGMVSLAANGFITIWPESGGPITIDAAAEMPGRGLPADRFGQGGVEVSLDYGGGITTVVRCGSVATPGMIAAYALASERYGSVPWARLFDPCIAVARQGFPLPRAAHTFLTHSHELIYGWNRDSYDALHDENGLLKNVGDRIHVRHLSDSLQMLAEEGARVFYQGELGHAIADSVQENGGILTREDLAAYEVVVRDSVETRIGDWQIGSAPPPSVGGATLIAMLQLLAGDLSQAAKVSRMIEVQDAVLSYRREHLDHAIGLDQEVAQLLQQIGRGQFLLGNASPSTVHTSAVDSDGLCCSITASSGYGSGSMPPGTGIWLNNSLGELELNEKGFHFLPPGTRLYSNMAPTVARSDDGRVLATGSPGAGRITTALLQTLHNYIVLGQPLDVATAAPRLHVDNRAAGTQLAYERGLDLPDLIMPTQCYENLHMFFGGVSSVCWQPESGFSIVADPRRVGGTARAVCRT